MDMTALCDMIELQPQVRDRVLPFAADFDFNAVDELQRGYRDYPNMGTALSQVQAVLGNDPDGTKILACMLRAALGAWDFYEENGISQEIFAATMKCFPRFLDETHRMTGEWQFDRWWWTTRQVGCHLFRLGALEYEMKKPEAGTVISIHIPSDGPLAPVSVDTSLRKAKQFFAAHYPALKDAQFRCHSWLLDPQLRQMLDESSNIRHFQDRFEIFDPGEAGNDVLEWVFHTRSAQAHTLPEETSLQRKLKHHLLSGGVIRNAYGKIKALP